MRHLSYLVPTVYLVVVFIAFQAISISSVRVDPDHPAMSIPTSAFVLTLPWSLLSSHFQGRLVFLPMVVGSILNAGLIYLIFRKSRRS